MRKSGIFATVASALLAATALMIVADLATAQPPDAGNHVPNKNGPNKSADKGKILTGGTPGHDHRHHRHDHDTMRALGGPATDAVGHPVTPPVTSVNRGGPTDLYKPPEPSAPVAQPPTPPAAHTIYAVTSSRPPGPINHGSISGTGMVRPGTAPATIGGPATHTTGVSGTKTVKR